MIYREVEKDSPEMEEKTMKMLMNDASKKLELIAKLKSGEGLIVPSEHAGKIGMNYLREYVLALGEVARGEDMEKRRLFNISLFDSPIGEGWEIRYGGRDYSIRISELGDEELYPELIIRRRR